MFEDKNINEFDLMMKSILDEGREEVPAGVWERVSESLDKVAASKRKPAAVIWFRRAGIAAAAAAAAIAVGVVLNHGTEEALLPDTGDSSLIAVVEQETSAEEHAATVEERAEAVTMLADAKRPAARKPATVTEATEIPAAEVPVTEIPVAEIPVAEIPETAQEFIESQSADNSAEAAEENIYFPEDWGEEKETFRPSTSIVLSGLAGTNSAQGQNRLSPQKAPVVTPAPEKTGIEETSTKSTYGIPVSAGVGVKIGLSPRWAVGIGANYTMLTRTFYGKYTQVNPDGTIASSTSSDIRNTQHYVGIPVNVYYNIISQDRVSLYAYGGGSAEKCISDDYNVLSTAISHREKVNGLQFSANAGIGVEFAIGKNLGVYIDPSLRYYFNNGQPKSIRTVQPLMFGFEMGLRVNL
ncbi:MAG: outer membrane beta-barrel protein [Bacteroidales bacterium]|nr:outer membrane beta-barrel protein [Bacteroidales bacterium]